MDCSNRILSENVYDVITDFPVEDFASAEVVCSVEIDDRFRAVYVNRPGMVGAGISFTEYPNTPKVYGLMQLGAGNTTFDPNNLIISGITQVQRPPLSLTGSGVVFCVIDTGIDYRNPVFLDENGNSRILAIWDQTIQDGMPPEGLPFGTEYSREEINRALRSENPYDIVPSRDEIGHGSELAGVAAGSNVRGDRPYIGAAPNADILVVKLKQCKQYLRQLYLIPDGVPAYAEQDIMLGIRYANSFAELFQRPVVICLGIGTNMGDHTGRSALAQYLDRVAVQRSRSVVVACGNEGNAAHHYRGRLMEGETTEVEVRVGENAQGFWLEMWGNLPDLIRVGIRTPGGEEVESVALDIRQSITYGFVYEDSLVTVDAAVVEGTTGDELVIFRVQRPTAGIWTFRVSAEGQVYNGTFHMWLPISDFLNTPVTFLESTPDGTLTEPATAREVLSIATYNGENSGLYIESGRGYTRDDRIKPDLAAPGVNVSTIAGRKSGSSQAAAIAAGAVTQLMQWAVVEGNASFANGREIKSYLIRGASRERGRAYPNREWGFGRLNLEETFRVLSDL